MRNKYGVQVTSGDDVYVTPPEDMLYSSEYQSPKLHNVYTGILRTNSKSYASVRVDHGLSYAPLVFAYYKRDGRWEIPDNNIIALETSPFYCELKTKADPSGDTEGNKLAANTDFRYKFWVFTDPAQELSI